MNKAKLSLRYLNRNQPALHETYFSFPDCGLDKHTIRGRTAGAYTAMGYGTFGWTSAVQALSQLCVQTKKWAMTGIDRPMISGSKGSLASSLDFSVSKDPLWLLDMFGLDLRDRPIIRRLLLRNNSGLKRPGSVCIALNSNILPPENLQFFIDDVAVESYQELDLLDLRIENQDLRASA